MAVDAFETGSPVAEVAESTGHPSFDAAARDGRSSETLTKAEQALRSDPEQLARIEAVLDDPSLAIPLADLG